MGKLNEVLKKAEQYFIAILLLLITLILFLNVVLRVFGASILWGEEFARYSMVWITFIGSSVCVYKGAHLGIDVVVNSLGGKARKALSIFIIVFSLLFTILFTYISLRMTLTVHNTNQYSSTMGIPMSLAYVAMPIGGLLMSIRYIEQLVRLVKDGEN